MKMRTKMSWVLGVAAFAMFSAGNVRAEDVCLNPELGKQPIQAEGRVMPLSGYAQRIRKNLFPAGMCKSLQAESLYCYLSTGQRAMVEQKYDCKLGLKAEHAKTQEALGLEKGVKWVAPEKAAASRENLVQTYHMLQRAGQAESGFGSDLSNLLMHIDRYQAIESGADWKVLGSSKAWTSLREVPEPARVQMILGSAANLTADEAKTLKIEMIYDQSHPFSIAMLFCLAGFLFVILALKDTRFAVWVKLFSLIVLAIQITGMALRVMVSGRAPVTNMYETVMWVGFGVFALATILGWKLKDQKIWAVGFAGNAICLFMLSVATKMLDGTIQPLVPVLRDNFWLSTHVTTITLSYACFALSWFVANFILVRWLLGHRSSASLEKWNYTIRLSIQIGSVMLAAGIILGGVWADYSWGRFWGWDPKETWSLIALVVYMGILHGRYVGWFKDIVFTCMGAVGFLFVLMAWFGVNYILAAGLHSYGFSSGGSAFLMTVFLAQVAVLAAVLGIHFKVFKAGARA